MTQQVQEQEQQQFAVADFRNALLALLKETFEEVAGHILDPGTSLFETLASVDAGEASKSASSRVATLAAQVDHTAYYLNVLLRHIVAGGYDETLKANWGLAWERTTVTPDEWDELNRNLHGAYTSVQEAISTTTTWNEDIIGGYLAILGHTTYHLGEIRQALGVIRA
jgi:hypothetical protein